MIMETDSNRLSTIRIIAGIITLLCGTTMFGVCCYGMYDLMELYPVRFPAINFN